MTHKKMSCDKLSLSQHLTALKCHILTMKIISMLYILTLLCNIRSFNTLIIIKLEYAVLALPDTDIILYKLSKNKIKYF